ncbi:MAG: glycosyltransferase family 2 protein [Chloroflexi bacterium]|nr:glycosyltransferase family 2 protein [Chloroflexota bacterium]
MLGILFWLCVLAVVYVYAGYPALVFLFSKMFNQAVNTGDVSPLVTLIFAAHNEEKVIEKKLENTLALEYPREQLQILVVNDGSMDRTAEIVRRYQNKGVELVDFPQRRGKLTALRDAQTKCRGEIILFSDADNFYPPNAVSETVKYFYDERVGAVSGGRDVIGEGALGSAEGLYWRYEEFIKRHESNFGSCTGVAGDLLAVRRRLYVPPPPNVINDDFFTALNVLRQGYRVVYSPTARSSHPVANTEHEEMERRARMVAGRYQAMFVFWRHLPWKYPVAFWQVISHKYMRPLVPLFMIAALIFTILSVVFPQSSEAFAFAWLFLYQPFNYVFLVLQMLFYSLAWFGRSFKSRGFVGKLIYIPVFLVNSNLAALQGLFRYLTSRQSVMWKKVAR